jgi:signal transduction histidine kinase
MGKLIDGTIEMVHRISADLRPGLLDDFGLVAALEWFAKDFQKRSGIVCRARLEVDDLALDKEMSTTIFRIFQETLTNVARHAEARRVEVRLAASGGRLILEVSDDGRGITKKQMNDPRSFGIIGMRERAHSWGGEVLISGNRDKGTTVRLTIPLAAGEAGA